MVLPSEALSWGLWHDWSVEEEHTSPAFPVKADVTTGGFSSVCIASAPGDMWFLGAARGEFLLAGLSYRDSLEGRSWLLGGVFLLFRLPGQLQRRDVSGTEPVDGTEVCNNDRQASGVLRQSCQANAAGLKDCWCSSSAWKSEVRVGSSRTQLKSSDGDRSMAPEGGVSARLVDRPRNDVTAHPEAPRAEAESTDEGCVMEGLFGELAWPSSNGVQPPEGADDVSAMTSAYSLFPVFLFVGTEGSRCTGTLAPEDLPSS